MPKIYLLFAAVVVVLAVLAMLKLKMAGGAKNGVYYLRKTLFTAAERSFLGVLDRVLPPGVTVFGKVRLADIFGVQSGLDPSTRQSARNRIDRKHVDFLLVRIDDVAPRLFAPPSSFAPGWKASRGLRPVRLLPRRGRWSCWAFVLQVLPAGKVPEEIASTS